MKNSSRSALRKILVAVSIAAVLFCAFLLWYKRDTTEYAPKFSEAAFLKIEQGMGVNQVYALLGHPISVRREDSQEEWCFGEAEAVRKDGAYIYKHLLSPPSCVVFDATGSVVRTTGAELRSVRPGMSEEQVLVLLGKPDFRHPAAAMTLHYSAPGGDGLFRGRIVAIDAKNRVSEVIRYQFHD